MSGIYEALREALAAAGQPFDEHPEEQYLLTHAAGAGGEWVLVAQAREERDQASIYSIRLPPVAEELREAVAILLTRINFGLYLGNFELDLSDGELRFKTSIDFGGLPPAQELLHPLIGTNLATMDTYLPVIDAVVAGESTDEVEQRLARATA